MNFQTMNKQRRFILLASVSGIISVFLPWVDTAFHNYNGFNVFGILVLLCFITSGTISIVGNKKLPLYNSWIIALTAGCIAVLVIAIFFLIKLDSILSIMSVFSYGFFIALLASIGVITAAFIFRPD